VGRVLATFPNRGEFHKARAVLEGLSLDYEVICPDNGFRLVGAPAVVVDSQVRMALAGRHEAAFTCSGWVEYHAGTAAVPGETPKTFEDDVFGEASIMVFAPCVADRTKVRFIAHISGDMTEVFPYLNAVMPEACYNARGPTFTFMDGYRMVALYPRRVVVAKADGVVDGWRVLEMIRRRANEAWAGREEIEPSYEMRERPPALEIFRRLPRTNCKACGELTCLAFAVSVYMNMLSVTKCRPVFAGEFGYLKDALLEVCAALGASDEAAGAD